MSTRTRWIKFFITLSVGLIMSSHLVLAANSVTLYTPYTKISVPPGESVDYSIDVINNSTELQNVGISLSGMPKGWKYELKSGGWNIRQLSILPGEKKSFSLKVEVPLNVNKGNYRYKVMAGEINELPLVINISEQGTFNTEFITDQPNMEGPAKSTFTFKAKLKNGTSEQQLYSLKADAQRGWNVSFKVEYKQVTSVNVDANCTENIVIEIVPPEKIEAGTYRIPISAETNATSANLQLEVVVKGSYNMELTTPTGLLSTDITAGDEKRIGLIVSNTGSSNLTDVKFSFNAPHNWDITFDPKIIEKLKPGEDIQVYATIKADKKAIAGDYVTTIDAKTPEVSSKASFRISVETPMLWGWIGILIIIIALGSVYYLFRKYGRR
jgi:uncharacterized membrane protein